MINDRLTELMEPLILAAPENEREGMRKEARDNPEGFLAFGVQSGYFAWVHANPGKIPTAKQIREFAKKLDQRRQAKQ